MQAEFKDTPRLIAQSSGLAMCFQFLGGTVSLSAGQAAFSSQLSRNLAKYAPTAPADLIANNPLELYNLPDALRSQALIAYTKSLNIVYILVVPACVPALLSWERAS